MTVAPYRLAIGHGDYPAGRLIDRSRPVVFQFDGTAYHGFAGDTLASALMANGVRVMGRSFKFHRPRSCISAGPEEPNAMVSVGAEGALTPNERATTVEIHDGLLAHSQNCWPSLAFDIGHLSGRLARLLPSGFQHKTFKWPAALWPFYERIIRRAAGLGPAPQHEDADAYEHVNVACEVLIAGGGVSGIAAARAAMEAGGRVIIAEQATRFGGHSDLFDATIDGAPTIEWIKENVAALATSEHVHLLTGTSVAGLYDHDFALLNERRRIPGSAAELRGDAVRERLWKVRAKQIIVATGAVERPLVFANNDRPGVMLASAIRAYVRRYAVAPGATGIIFTNNDDGYQTACDLFDQGIDVKRVVDIRTEPRGAVVDGARERGIEISAGRAVANVDTSFSGREIKAVQIGAVQASGKGVELERISCDFVGVSGGWNPQAHLTAQCGGKLKWDASIQSLKPGTMGAAVHAVGAANGNFSLKECLAQGYAAGERAATTARGGEATRAKAPLSETVTEARKGPQEPIGTIPAGGEQTRHFVDLASDVTVADIHLAVREGYHDAEHLKRYTALGMGNDQGKTGNANALAIHAQATGIAIADTGTTTFRPPYLPVTFGAIAGMAAKDLFQPARRTPVWHWHRNNSANFEPVHLWHRPFCYGAGEAAREVAVEREVRAVRNAVGILDASTLGKIEVRGPDAGRFLDRIYCRTISTLEIGRCRYGLMLDEQGFVLDDGVVARLGVDHYLLHTTSSGAEHIYNWLECWLQTEWPDLRAFITPVTEQWAQFVVAGPRARDVVQELEGDINFAGADFPFLSLRQGVLAGVSVRVFRVSYTGELSYEIAAPANRASALWDAILSAGEPYGITPFGTEALHVLRAEKGYIAIGEETDGTVTPLDLGFGWMISKDGEDFIGKFGLERPDLTRPDRLQLVGLESIDHGQILPQGACLTVETESNAETPNKPAGHVTSSHHSPTLGRPIALALIKGGRERYGETVSCPAGRELIKARIVKPAFYDMEGARQND